MPHAFQGRCEQRRQLYRVQQNIRWPKVDHQQLPACPLVYSPEAAASYRDSHACHRLMTKCCIVCIFPKYSHDKRKVAYCVQGLEQSEAVMRLGLKLAFNPKRCSLHFQLNVANPEHAEVAKKLVDMAQKVSAPASLT